MTTEVEAELAYGRPVSGGETSRAVFAISMSIQHLEREITRLKAVLALLSD